MSLRSRILVLLAVILTAVATMTLVAVVVLESASASLAQVQTAHRQYQAIVSLSDRANAYSEQIAETLLLGDSERADYIRARERTDQAFARLRVRLDDDLAATPAGPARARELAELERLRAMRRTYRELEAAAERAFVLNAAGRRAEALALFQSSVEDGLDLTLQRAIAEAVEGEAEELAAATANFDRWRARLLPGVLLVSVVLLGVSVSAGFALFRAVMRPVQRLTEGAQALEAGRLEHRIPVLGGDELGRLAHRFNAMAEELARQRDHLLEARHDLEQQVEERTAALAAANGRLVELDRQRVAFLADVSHELRTPLTALRSEAEIALRALDPAATGYREGLTRIVERAVEMGRLIEDLLFIARSEGGQVSFEPRPFDLEEAIRPALRSAAPLARARGITLAEPATPALRLTGDPRRVSQALVVLLDNAIRYSPPGGRVELRAEPRGDVLALVVRDWGAGVAAEELPHVFDRFFRGVRSVELFPGGSGLGLPIARWIARQHGGDVTLERRGDGTDAVLRLPRTRAALAA